MMGSGPLSKRNLRTRAVVGRPDSPFCREPNARYLSSTNTTRVPRFPLWGPSTVFHPGGSVIGLKCLPRYSLSSMPSNVLSSFQEIEHFQASSISHRRVQREDIKQLRRTSPCNTSHRRTCPSPSFCFPSRCPSRTYYNFAKPHVVSLRPRGSTPSTIFPFPRPVQHQELMQLHGRIRGEVRRILHIDPCPCCTRVFHHDLAPVLHHSNPPDWCTICPIWCNICPMSHSIVWLLSLQKDSILPATRSNADSPSFTTLPHVRHHLLHHMLHLTF